MKLSITVAGAGLAWIAASPAMAQEAYRCTSPDGKVTYQQTPCPKASQEGKVDITPANTDFDPRKREELLKQGDEAGRKLEARAAEEEAARRKRAEAAEREAAQRERETQAREEAREEPYVIYGRPPGWRPLPSPTPPPRPQPRPSGK